MLTLARSIGTRLTKHQPVQVSTTKAVGCIMEAAQAVVNSAAGNGPFALLRRGLGQPVRQQTGHRWAEARTLTHVHRALPFGMAEMERLNQCPHTRASLRADRDRRLPMVRWAPARPSASAVASRKGRRPARPRRPGERTTVPERRTPGIWARCRHWDLKSR